jgi:Sulfite exporter TauE/SafE
VLIVGLASVGAIGGFFSGLLGFGGGVVMFPLLYYIPPLLGLEELHAKTVAAVVMTQVFFSTLVGGLAHLRSGRVHGRIALVAGISSPSAPLSGEWHHSRGSGITMDIRTISTPAFRHCHPPGNCHDVSTGPKQGARKNFARKGLSGADSFVSMLAGHRDPHRLSRRWKFRLRSVTDLCPKSPDTNRHRQQSLYRDDQYLPRISRQACHRPNTLAHNNGGGFRSQHRNAVWREDPPPVPHPYASLYVRCHGRADRR